MGVSLFICVLMPSTHVMGWYVKRDLSQCMRFPTMLHFDMCSLGRASAASF